MVTDPTTSMTSSTIASTFTVTEAPTVPTTAKQQPTSTETQLSSVESTELPTELPTGEPTESNASMEHIQFLHNQLREWSLITGRGGATKMEGGGQVKCSPLKKGGGGILAMLKGGHKRFWGSFYPVLKGGGAKCFGPAIL